MAVTSQPSVTSPTPGTLDEDGTQGGTTSAPPPSGHWLHTGTSAVLGAILTALCLAWACNVPYFLGAAYYREQFLVLVLGLAIALAYNTMSWRGRPHAGFSPLDFLIGLIGLGTCLYVAFDYERLLGDVAYRTEELLIISSVLVLLTLEGLRRVTGLGMFLVVIAFLVYALFAHLMPLEIQGKQQHPITLAVYLGFDPSAILGIPLVVGATIVIMYILLGSVLMRAGGGEFFMDLATATMGHRRGGPAKIAVVGSAMFGTVSGSSISSVASTGVFTIPMMKRSGYTARDAGAIEAVASTGGQLAPPVMGAAAFLMAEFVEMPYPEIALAATIPAFIYYWGLYWQVDLIAGRDRLQTVTEKLETAGQVLKDGWHFLVPFATLIIVMFGWRTSPELAAIIASLCMLLVGLIRPYRGKRLHLSDAWHAMSDTGRSTGDLFLTLAGAGIVIGVLSATGLAYALSLLLVKIAGQDLFLLLAVAGLVSIVLGMGMPTTAVYVLLATLIAPSLIQAGVPKLAAHMFILYFGMLSMITPPVALAAFAAANISKAGIMETAWAACVIGWTKFALPIMFVLSPTLLLIGPIEQIALDTVTALIGVYIVTVGIVGYFQERIGWAYRLLMLVLGGLAVVPSASVGVTIPWYVSVVATIVGMIVLAMDYKLRRRGATAPAT
jgi:TRAP transporter 4TM/12TM fusion protein